MHPKLAFYVAYALVDLGGGLLIIAVQMAALFEARRKGLTAFGRWLVPSILASIVFLIAQIFGAESRHLGISLSFVRLYRFGIDTMATALALVAVFQLWRLVRGWPVGAGGEHSPSRQAAGQGEGVWPPPPAGPA